MTEPDLFSLATDSGCEACSHLVRTELGGSCRLHRFVMPRTGYDTICRDWGWGGSAPPPAPVPYDTLQGLADQRLYAFFAYYPGVFEPLGDFSDLQHPLLGGRVLEDAVFGWSLYINQQHQEFYPEPGEEVTLMFADEPHTFRLAEAVRTRQLGGRMNERNEWEPLAYTQNEQIVYSPADPGALYRWLNRHLDLEKLFAEEQAGQLGDFLKAIGVAVWVDVVERGKTYMLRPDLLPVQKYKR